MAHAPMQSHAIRLPATGPINGTDRCWICPETCSIEEHHIIPRCYGGEKGPTVYICSVCHSLVHAVADELGDTPSSAITTIAQGARQVFVNENVALTHAIFLVRMIQSARELVKQDPNKTAVFQTRFSARTRTQLRGLRKVFPRLNQEKLVVLAIDNLYKKHLG